MKIALTLIIAYALFAGAILGDIFHWLPTSLLVDSFLFGLPVLIAALRLPTWAVGLLALGAVPSWIGSAVWKICEGSDTAVLDDQLLQLIPLFVLVTLAFVVSSRVQARIRRAEVLEAVARVERVMQRKATREEVADEMLSQGRYALGASVGVLWLADPASDELSLLAQHGLSPATQLACRRARAAAHGISLTARPTPSATSLVDLQHAPPTATLLAEIGERENARFAYVQQLFSGNDLAGLVIFLKDTPFRASETTREYVRQVSAAGASHLHTKPRAATPGPVHVRSAR